VKRASGSEAQRVGTDAADPVTNVCLDGKAADRMRRVGVWKLGQGPWHSHRHAPTAWGCAQGIGPRMHEPHRRATTLAQAIRVDEESHLCSYDCNTSDAGPG